MESVLRGGPDDRPLPVVVYLDDIAVYGDTQEEVLEDTLEAVKRLAAAGFMLNLRKSQLVQAAAQVLGHLWTSGGFWAPNVTKLAALIEKTDGELARANRASLYGLLNFYREYVPAFAELVEPLRQLLGQDARPWTPEAGECVREVARRVIKAPRWLNADLSEELRMETRVSSRGIAALLLQRHPGKPRTWTPVASWGRCIEPLEKMESRVLLELKALREGAWKMGEFTAFSRKLTMQVTPELRALLKVAPKAHPELQAMLIDVQQYKPTWAVGGASAAPEELDFPSSNAGEWEQLDDPVDLDDMHCAESALGKVSLPPKARFVPGKAVHV